VRTTKTHFTLTTWFNVVLIVVWAVAVAAFLSIARPRPLLSSAIGAGAGLMAGILQRKSVQSSAAIFAEAKSALEVRRAFKSNRPGKLSIATTWVTGFGLLAVALAQGGNALLGLGAGYVSFMLLREIVGFGAIAEVRRNVPDRQRAF